MAIKSAIALRGGLDLDGRIVIKVQLGNDVRKMLIHNDDVTYDELVLMMQRIYKGTIKQDDELTIKYKDEDGDLITIFDSSDVSFAIQTCNRQLKLVIYVNGLERSFDDAEVATIRKGLKNVRDLVNSLLDQIDAKNSLNTRLEAATDNEAEAAADEQVSSVNPLAASQVAIDSKEFDPFDISRGQADSSAGGDTPTSQKQYGGSQFNEQVTKSFDQMSMSDRQSVNQSPTPSNLQSSFGSAFTVNASQQPPAPASQPNSMTSYSQATAPASQPSSMTSYSQAPAPASQPSNMISGSQPAAPPMSTPAYYSNPTTSSQYATTQAGMGAGGQQPGQQQPGQQQPGQQQPAQQPFPQPPQTQQYNYGQSQQWGQQQTQQQPTQQMPAPNQPQQQYGYMPGAGVAPGVLPPGAALPPGAPGAGVPPAMAGAQQLPQAMYAQQSAAAGTNPYSKPGQVGGSYPRASGAYPQLSTNAQHPTYRPQ